MKPVPETSGAACIHPCGFKAPVHHLHGLRHSAIHALSTIQGNKNLQPLLETFSRTENGIYLLGCWSQEVTRDKWQEVCVHVCVLKYVYENGSPHFSVQITFFVVTLYFTTEKQTATLGDSASLSCYAWACAFSLWSKLKNYLYLLLADKKGQAQLVVIFHCINTSVIVRLSEFVFVKGRNWVEEIKSSHQLKNKMKEDMSVLKSFLLHLLLFWVSQC